MYGGFKPGLRFLDLRILFGEFGLGLCFRVFEFCPSHELLTGYDACPREVGNIDSVSYDVANVLKPMVPVVMSLLDLHQEVFLKIVALVAVD
jgi:hypothetical protein